MRLVTPSDALRSPFFRLVADVQRAEEDFAPIRRYHIDLAKKSSGSP